MCLTVSIMMLCSTTHVKVAFSFLFYFALFYQLKGSSGDNVKQSSSVSYSYHLLVPVTDGQSTWTSNSSYTWVHGDFGPCSVTCGGGNYTIDTSI